jgi:hypothetical protein
MSTDESSVELTLTLPEPLIDHIGALASRLGWSAPELVNAAAALGLWVTQSSMGFFTTVADPSIASYLQGSLNRALTPAALLSMAGIGEDASAGAALGSLTVTVSRADVEATQPIAEALGTDLTSLATMGLPMGLLTIELASSEANLDPADWRRLLRRRPNLALLGKLLAASTR